MTELDSKIIPKVNAALDRFGVPAVLTDPSSQDLDTSTGGLTGSPTTHNVSKASPPVPLSAALIESTNAAGAGDQLQYGDVSVYVKGPAAIGCHPKAGWSLAIASRTFVLVEVVELWSGESIAAFELRGRE